MEPVTQTKCGAQARHLDRMTLTWSIRQTQHAINLVESIPYTSTGYCLMKNKVTMHQPIHSKTKRKKLETSR